MSKQAVVLVAGLLVAGLLVVGCGDDSNDASAGVDGEAITKAALIEQGDTICRESEKRTATEGTKLLAKTEKEGNDLQIEIIELVVAPEFHTLVDDLEALGVPSGDEEQIGALMTTLQERADLATEDPQGFLRVEGSRGGPLSKKAKAQAGTYGFQVCLQHNPRS